MAIQGYLQAIVSLLCILCGPVIHCRADTEVEFPLDFRITAFKDLGEEGSVSLYSHPHIEHYSRVALDLENNQVIVGAKNSLLRLSLDDLSQLEVTDWHPANISVAVCTAKGQPLEVCNNYIRVLLVHGDQIFTCGTNAFAPRCSWRSSTKLSEVTEWQSGVAKCPYNPAHNTTALMTAEGDMYSTTVTDFTARDPAIYRLMGPSKILRTVQHNSRWLNEPDFVSSYEIGDFVYFFFREVAVEYINCGKRIYSRVARICKGDKGGKLLLEENWTTFTKARLNCSLPGSYPFYFDQIQGTFYDEKAGLVYAAFTTADTSIYGTAVCAYNLTAFQQAFGGPFKYQENAEQAWVKVTNSQPITQCPASDNVKKRSQNESPQQRMLVDAQKFQIMDLAVQPVHQRPIVFMENQRFSHIVVDQVHGKHHQTYEVVFVATLEGRLKKMAHIPGEKEACVIEELELTEEPQPITSMRLVPGHDIIIVTTTNSVLRIPTQRCHRFLTKQSCLNAQDPYCGWDSERGGCTRVPDEMPAHNWHQEIIGCPVLRSAVDGGWSDFGEWKLCAHMNTGESRMGDSCYCRARTCTNPRPQFGGSFCSGITVEVSNCTSNGGWTSWSSWSSCTATCGVAVRSRQRTCGNPQPSYGGRVCVGPAVYEEYCIDNPDCPVDGGWSAWSDWSMCTSKCGQGVQSRTRQCNSPEPKHGGHRCYHNDQEWKMCNKESCPELKKISDWTPWIRKNVTREGTLEERYRYVCRANVADARHIRIGGIRTAARMCPPNGCDSGDSSYSPEDHDIDGAWSAWSLWSTCDADCDTGTMYRERKCDDPAPLGNGRECIGHSRAVKECNIHSCEGEWSCWSEFSSCSRTCGEGTKFRSRKCTSPYKDRIVHNTCKGTDRDDAMCYERDCPDNDAGWGEWTLWSECTVHNIQQRKRRCLFEFPRNQCNGPDMETRMCQFNAINNVASINLAESRAQPIAHSSHTNSGGRIQIYHLIITALLSFALGGVISVGMFLYCQRWRRAKHHHGPSSQDNKMYSTLTKHQEVKPNHYITPSELDVGTPIGFGNGNTGSLLRPTQLHNNSSTAPSMTTLNSKYYSTNSLQRPTYKDTTKMTVKEATLKRDSMLRNNQMRTNLMLQTNDY